MKTIITLCLLALTSVLFAQSNMQDVIYLKSGSVIRGKILSQPSNDKVRIELSGGSIFVFQRAEIDSITKENLCKRQLQDIRKNYYRQDRGYRNMTEFGFLFDLSANNPGVGSTPTPVAFNYSLHTVNGYQIWPYLYVGAGIGIDRVAEYQQTFTPFYLRLASEFLKKRVTPYVYCDAGFSYMWQLDGHQQDEDEYSYYRNQGGLYIAAGGGIRIYTHSRASVIVSASYKLNKSETSWTYSYDEYYYNNASYTINRTYQWLSINTGVTF